jgi:hypothetical protein
LISTEEGLQELGQLPIKLQIHFEAKKKSPLSDKGMNVSLCVN